MNSLTGGFLVCCVYTSILFMVTCLLGWMFECVLCWLCCLRVVVGWVGWSGLLGFAG